MGGEGHFYYESHSDSGSICHRLEELAALWLRKSPEKRWQQLFLALGLQDELEGDLLKNVLGELRSYPDTDVPATPQSDAPRTKIQSAETPEKKGPMPRRVNECRPAKFGQPPVPDTVLRAPAKRKMQAVSEEQIPAAASLELEEDAEEDLSTK